MGNRAFASAFEHLQEYEERDLRFYVMTRITVGDVLQFYTTLGRFPTDKEIEAMHYFGIDRVIPAIQIGKPMIIDHTRWSDLSKLDSAKARFADTCKDVLRKFFGKVTKK